MTQRIKVGNVYVELPKDHTTPLETSPQSQSIRAEKPETPESLEEQQHIYRTNDPFQYSIDQARAVASISSSQKPWVKKTWFVIFVVGPLLFAELAALAIALESSAEDAWKGFLAVNAVSLPVWLVYYSIWRRKVRKPKR